MDAVNNWLVSGGGYSAGVALYLAHGKDALLKKLFKEEWSAFKEQKLRVAMLALTGVLPPVADTADVVDVPLKALKEELSELQYQLDEVASEKDELEESNWELEEYNAELQSEVKKLKNVAKNAPKGWPADMDATIKALHDEWMPLFMEKKNLQSRIYDVAKAGEKTEAGAMAHRILDLRDECRHIYKKRDHYLVHKKLPEEPKLIELPVDKNKWPITLQNYQRYVREYKKKLAAAPGDANFLKQLEKYQWGVAELKKLMGL